MKKFNYDLQYNEEILPAIKRGNSLYEHKYYI